MDRLTTEGQDFENQFCAGCGCKYYGEPDGCNHPDGYCESYTYFTLVADKLKNYEDAEEQGRLVVLPCKAGDVVYSIEIEKIYAREIISISLFRSTCISYFLEMQARNNRGATIPIGIDDFGKTVFLTREDAEKALKERESNG